MTHRSRRLAGWMIALAGAVLLAAVTVVPALGRAGTSSPTSLVSFGDNYYGQLGQSGGTRSGAPNPTPAPVALPGQVGSLMQVAAGSDFSLALTSGAQLYGFGDNQYGQLGSATNNVGNTPNPTPTPITLPGAAGTATQVAAGYDHSLALTTGDQLYAFGDNYHGQLGSPTNTTTSAANPTPTVVTLPGQTGTITHIAAGDDTSLVATSGGELYAFGANDFGQLGVAANNATNNPNPNPLQIQLPGGSGSVTALASGDDFSLVATSGGELYSFGDNFYGQLGTATNTGVNTPNPNPTSVALPGQSGAVTALAAGNGFSLALTASGQLYAFGTNFSGQLGTATNAGTGTANPTPTLVSLPGQSGTVSAIAAGADFSLVATSSGQLYAFGDGGEGQLGSASATGPDNPTPALVTLPTGAATAVAASAGTSHSLVIAAGSSGGGGGGGGGGGSGPVTLTIDTTGGGTGSVYGSAGCAKPSAAAATCSTSFPAGTVITLNDTTTGSTAFIGWESFPPRTSCSGPGTCTLTLTANTTVAAIFQTPQTLTTTAEGDGQGTIVTSDYNALLHRGLRCPMPATSSTTTCSIRYPYGTEETLSARPVAGSRFVGWSGACSGTGACGVFMDRTQSVTANFSYTIGVHLNAIEITQGVQTTELPTRTGVSGFDVAYKGVVLASEGGASPRETVKLADGRATVVRVYANTALPLNGASPPPMRLYEVRNGHRLGPIGPDYTPPASALPVGPVGQVTAAQRYSTASVYTFTLPTAWSQGNASFIADANPDPTAFFGHCTTAICQEAAIELDAIHFNRVTTVHVVPIEMVGPGVAIRGVKPTLPDPDPAWTTVQDVLPLSLQVAPYQFDLVLGPSFTGCDGVTQAAGQTTSAFAQAVYAARNATALVDVEKWASASGNTSPSVYPWGDVARGITNTCTGSYNYSGGVTQPGPGLYSNQAPVSLATDDRPLTAMAHELHHGLALPHAGIQCGSGTFGVATQSTAATTNASTTMTLTAPNGALAVGQPITGAGITQGTLISAIAKTTITMSQPATSSNPQATYDFGQVSTGTSTQGSAVLTSVGLAGALTPGQPIFGPGIPSGAFVEATSGFTVTMSAYASSSNAGGSYAFGQGGAGQVGSAWPPTFVDLRTSQMADGLLDGVGLMGLDNEANAPYRLRGPAVQATSNAEFFDLMSYCASESGAWLSVRNWNYDVGFHAPAPTYARDGAAARPYVALAPASVAGARSLAITAVYDPLRNRVLTSGVVPSSSAPTPVTRGATYALTARNRSGAPVARGGVSASLVHFDPDRTGQGGGSLILLQGKVPATGVREIDVLRAGAAIERDRASAHAPSAALIAPRRGVRLGGARGALVRWRSHDADGGQLQATLSFSGDAGRSWREVYSGPDTGRALLPPGLMSASRRARLRLYVSDGFNEAIATSPIFISTGAPPQLGITAPTRSFTLRSGAPLNLTAVAFGDGGTRLTGRALIWRVGRQRLGFGAAITTTALPVGRHLITVTARTPAGAQSMRSVRVTVLAAPPILTVLGAPRRLGARARSVSLRIATLAPASIAVGRRRVGLGPGAKRVTLAVRPGASPLAVVLTLHSGRYVTVVHLTIPR